MPLLGGATGWLNSEPLSPAELRGHIVVVNFWTLTCINWLRQEPYVRAWSQAYRADGLVVIGVHTPEFSFEHELDLVRQATRARGIDYPVAVDNDYAIWSAFDNHYWPALYFVDTDGIIVDQHFGEGRYEQSERVIQQLLGIQRELVSVEGVGVEAEADWDHLRTPETYLGYGRGDQFASPDGATFDERRAYELPEHLHLNHWALAGEWTIGRERVVLDQAGGPSPTGSAPATPIWCCPPERASRFPSACSSTARLPARHTVWTSTSTGTACSPTAACTSSCASTTRSATGPWRSRSWSPAPKRTCSRLGSGAATRPPHLESAYP
jgi:thiol-disulfide isomerase/thioredoxin